MKHGDYVATTDNKQVGKVITTFRGKVHVQFHDAPTIYVYGKYKLRPATKEEKARTVAMEALQLA